MITQELVQRVQKLVNVYNQTHEEQFTITYHNNLYRLTHSDVPKLELFINYFNSSKNPDDAYIQTAFETVTKLIAIYDALNKTFQAEHPFFYKDCIGIHEGNHKTILKPSSNQTVMVEQTYLPNFTKINFTKDDIDVLVTPNDTHPWIKAYYTAKADVPLDEINNTIEALRKKTQTVSVFK